MKKLICAVCLTVSSLAMASEQIELGYRLDSNRSTSVDTDNLTFNYKKRFDKHLEFNLGATNAQRETDNRLTNRYNVGLGYNHDWFYARADFGQRLVSGSHTTDFWQAEVGTRMRLSKTLTARVGYSYRDAFSDHVDDLQKGYRLSITQELDKRWNVSGKYDLLENSQGQKIDRFGISIARKF